MKTLIATAAIALSLVSTGALAFLPDDCRVSDQSGSPGLQKYCARLHQKLVAADPGHGLIGKLERAAPIEGEPESQHYYWIVAREGSQVYFNANTDIGRKILKNCKVGQLCAVKAAVEKSWEHNLDHATFWIAKIMGEPIGE